MFSFANPDFSVRELRSNLVLRWEYCAGSTMHLVWTQGRENPEPHGAFSAPADLQRLFRAHHDNTFRLKVSHWFSS